MLVFSGIDILNPGIIKSILEQSYAGLLSHFPNAADAEREAFVHFDKLVIENPNTIGKCVIVSSVNKKVIGFASFDPRPKPEYGIIGHNCVLPQFQGSGFGRLQIIKVLQELRLRGVQRAKVSTGDHPFFEPAQRMYIASGFKEVRRGVVRSESMPFTMIEYKQALDLPLGSGAA